MARTKATSKAKPKAKAKSAAKPAKKPAKKPPAKKAAAKKPPAKKAAPAKAAAQPPARAKPPAAKPAKAAKPASPPPTNGAASTTAIAPFTLSETEPGRFSLLLNQFEPAGAVFAAAGIDGGGYAWEGVAKYVVASEAADLADRFGLDPEASMFCAYGHDRAALEELGARLAALFHDASRLSAVIQSIGPDGFDD